jgi:hypothetical protein
LGRRRRAFRKAYTTRCDFLLLLRDLSMNVILRIVEWVVEALQMRVSCVRSRCPFLPTTLVNVRFVIDASCWKRGAVNSPRVAPVFTGGPVGDPGCGGWAPSEGLAQRRYACLVVSSLPFRLLGARALSPHPTDGAAGGQSGQSLTHTCNVFVAGSQGDWPAVLICGGEQLGSSHACWGPWYRPRSRLWPG